MTIQKCTAPFKHAYVFIYLEQKETKNKKLLCFHQLLKYKKTNYDFSSLQNIIHQQSLVNIRKGPYQPLSLKSKHYKIKGFFNFRTKQSAFFLFESKREKKFSSSKKIYEVVIFTYVNDIHP